MESSLVYDKSAESYFETDIYPPAPMKTKNPIAALMHAAERNGLKVFMSCGFYGIWYHTKENITGEAVKERAFKAMKQLYELYGDNKAFYGWYLPDETEINPYFDEDFIKYVNEYAEYGRSFNKNLKILIAPYGTRFACTDEHYIEQLKRLDCDIIAYQDEVGVEKSTTEETRVYFERLNKAHKIAGKSAIWADMETFQCEGKVYFSNLIAADSERVKKQMESISDYVDEIIISDVDEWVLKNTVDNLQDALSATIIPQSDDKIAAESADFSIASSTMIPVKENILKKVPDALTIV